MQLPPSFYGKFYGQLSLEAKRSFSGNASVPLLVPFKSMLHAEQTILLAYSRHLVPQSGQPPNVLNTGFWQLDRSPAWKPTPDLARFLGAGPPPIYVGFGSMPIRQPRQVAHAILAAVRSLGARAILDAGWSTMEPSDLRDDAIVVKNVPHDWLFERVARRRPPWRRGNHGGGAAGRAAIGGGALHS